MASFFEYIKLHPIAGISLVLLIAVTIFVWYKAIQSGKVRNENREKIIADIEKEKKLRNDYRVLTDEVINGETDNYRLIQGVCANIQMSIEKIPDINAAFNALPNEKKNLYCIGYVLEDSKEKLSNFFRSNGEPLLSQSKVAVDEIIGGKFAEIFNSEFDMFDENNEDVSVDNKIIDETDKAFSAFMAQNDKLVYQSCVNYIKAMPLN